MYKPSVHQSTSHSSRRQTTNDGQTTNDDGQTTNDNRSRHRQTASNQGIPVVHHGVQPSVHCSVRSRTNQSVGQERRSRRRTLGVPTCTGRWTTLYSGQCYPSYTDPQRTATDDNRRLSTIRRQREPCPRCTAPYRDESHPRCTGSLSSVPVQ